jgi:hypothetical protein
MQLIGIALGLAYARSWVPFPALKKRLSCISKEFLKSGFGIEY